MLCSLIIESPTGTLLRQSVNPSHKVRLADTLGFAVDAERWERILHPLLRTGTTEFIDLLRRHLQELCGFFNRQYLVVIKPPFPPRNKHGIRASSLQIDRFTGARCNITWTASQLFTTYIFREVVTTLAFIEATVATHPKLDVSPVEW